MSAHSIVSLLQPRSRLPLRGRCGKRRWARVAARQQPLCRQPLRGLVNMPMRSSKPRSWEEACLLQPATGYEAELGSLQRLGPGQTGSRNTSRSWPAHRQLGQTTASLPSSPVSPRETTPLHQSASLATGGVGAAHLPVPRPEPGYSEPQNRALGTGKPAAAEPWTQRTSSRALAPA